jgi:plasmid maintenance system antidote protein VapI
MPARLGLPPGSVPVEPVRSAIRRYRAGRGTDAGLVDVVDRHGDALEVEIARHAVERMDEFARGVRRLEALHARLADLTAQAVWLRTWPSGPDRRAVPLSIELDGRHITLPAVLAALGGVQLDSRVARQGARPRPRRRGAAASMAALADAGKTTRDVAQVVQISPSRVWAMLNGHQPPTPELWGGLAELVGRDRAWLVRDGIPKHPRARAPASRAVTALNGLGITAEDLAALICVQPGTVRRWLRGTQRAPAELAAALEQLVDVETAGRIVALIPGRGLGRPLDPP